MKRTKKPADPKPGETMEALITQIASKKQVEQTSRDAHLKRMAWAVYGHLVYAGVLPMHDLDIVEDKDKVRILEAIDDQVARLSYALGTLVEIEESIG